MGYICVLYVAMAKEQSPKNKQASKKGKLFNVKVKYDCLYQVTLGFLGLLPAILGTITIPVAVVQVLGAVATHVPHTHLLPPGLLGLGRLAVSKNANHPKRNQA